MKNKYLTVVLQITIAVVLNFFLFIMIPALHNLFGINLNEKKDRSNKKIIAEFYKPKKKKEKQIKRDVRKIKTSSGKGDSKPMQFKFTPDLGVEGAEGVAVQSSDLEAMVFEEGETDEDAVPVYTPTIPYPQRARELAVEGDLVVIFVVNERGRVENINIVKSPHSSIKKKAISVISKWKFRPAEKDGVPVKVRVKQVIEFALE